MPGLTTLPVLAAAFALGLNVPVAQVVNLCATPLNLAAVVPFKTLGELVLRVEEPVPLSVSALAAGLRSAPLETLGSTGWALAFAIVGWLVFLPLGTLALYGAALPATRALLRRYGAGAAPDASPDGAVAKLA